ncbi:MAG TPA: MarR family transcriptional regulator [Bacteroidia bacterium]|nr:MarR family transcriptional regulator [Bacteroidia bacterium]
MNLEQEIKQTRPFRSEYQKLLINIQFTGSFLQTTFARMLKPYGLSPQQYNVLRILKGKHPQGYCNQEITARMIDRSSNSTRIADKLEEKKLITRNEHKSDRRQVDIRISRKGLELLEEIETTLHAFRHKVKNFNEEKAKLMNEWLDELRNEQA